MTKTDLRELNKIINQVPEDKRPVAKQLVSEIKFMAQTMDDLKAKIEEYGTVELFENGKQKFLRENPACKTYNTMVARYSTLYKQLTDLLPKSAPVQPENALLDFICQD